MPQDASNNIVRDTRGLSGFHSQFRSHLEHRFYTLPVLLETASR